MTRVLDINDNFSVRSHEPVHSGKVRSVYWLTPEDSRRLIDERGYNADADASLALMIVSDRISAFDCIWHGENGLHGVPGKGAALNAVSKHWFDLFAEQGIGKAHVLEAPHPLVWIVQRARPVRIEAIARRYITGSMWRDYANGAREICGLPIPDGLTQHQRLPSLLVTPSTKGVLRGLEGVPEADDVNISRWSIENHWQSFGFQCIEDIARYEAMLKRGFEAIEAQLADVGQLFVDTKFEFGYVNDAEGHPQLIYMDEIGTPDSSRIWDAEAYGQGKTVEQSKEGFRQALLAMAPDPDVLLNKNRMPERQAYACATTLPASLLMEVSATYLQIAETIMGRPVDVPADPRAEIEALIAEELRL